MREADYASVFKKGLNGPAGKWNKLEYLETKITTYENVVCELWGHAKHNESIIPFIQEKASEVDINKKDQNGLNEIEKNFVTWCLGGGNANAIGDGPEDSDGRPFDDLSFYI